MPVIHKSYKDSRYREFEREFDEQFESETNKTKIYLDRSNRKLGGVCAGIARYFNIQPLFVRIGAVVLFFVALEAVLVAYGLAYLILDDYRT
jgi:phage shock protein PspC (stress-responsive transcriptional regulator)